MEIKIKSFLEGAKEAEGTSVIIDVFRASNTIIACLGQGVEYVIPVGNLEEAISLKKKYNDYLLFGERKGLKPNGFDFGNSPYETSKLNLKDKKIILTTSAGSQGIINATKAKEILIGSFANTNAIVSYIKNKNPAKVTLVAIGFEAYKKAEEDELCAEYIKGKLLGEIPDFAHIRNKVLNCDGANRLINLGQKDDLEFCLKLDTYDIVPRFNFLSWKIINQIF